MEPDVIAIYFNPRTNELYIESVPASIVWKVREEELTDEELEEFHKNAVRICDINLSEYRK